MQDVLVRYLLISPKSYILLNIKTNLTIKKRSQLGCKEAWVTLEFKLQVNRVILMVYNAHSSGGITDQVSLLMTIRVLNFVKGVP